MKDGDHTHSQLWFHLKNEYEWVLKNSGKRHIPDLAKSKVLTALHN